MHITAVGKQIRLTAVVNFVILNKIHERREY